MQYSYPTRVLTSSKTAPAHMPKLGMKMGEEQVSKIRYPHPTNSNCPKEFSLSALHVYPNGFRPCDQTGMRIIHYGYTHTAIDGWVFGVWMAAQPPNLPIIRHVRHCSLLRRRFRSIRSVGLGEPEESTKAPCRQRRRRYMKTYRRGRFWEFPARSQRMVALGRAFDRRPHAFYHTVIGTAGFVCRPGRRNCVAARRWIAQNRLSDYIHIPSRRSRRMGGALFAHITFAEFRP